MASILQINLNGCELAQNLLVQTCNEKCIDLVCISEQYTGGSNSDWYADESNLAAVWIPPTSSFRTESHGSGRGFAWVKVEDITFVSCYYSPNLNIADYRREIDCLEDFLRSVEPSYVVGGDFNARAAQWGMLATNSRGVRVLEMIARLDLLILNAGNTPTYRRPGFGESIPDITMASMSVGTKITYWRVLEDLTASDHQYIRFNIGQPPKKEVLGRKPRYQINKIKVESFNEYLISAPAPICSDFDIIPATTYTNILVKNTLGIIQGACEIAMPK